MTFAADLRTGTQWALARINSYGVPGVSITLFDLVNLQTGRAHRMKLLTGGIGFSAIKLPISGGLASKYKSFTTPRPVNFTDFDGDGARLTSDSAILYGNTYLTVWDGAAYFGSKLLYIHLGGWSLSTPGAYSGHGVTSIEYGDGNPLGTVATIPPEPDVPTDEPTTIHATYVSQEKVEFEMAGDALFPFDRPKPGEIYKFDHDQAALKTLQYAGRVIQSRPGKVEVIGYTDSMGKDDYNQPLSERRAAAVRSWLIEQKYVGASEIGSHGNGSQYPAAPNTKPDGSDDPAGRAKNRRVEIVIDKR